MKKDLSLSFLAGLLAGIFLYPTLSSLRVSFPLENIFLFIVLPLGAAFFIFAVKKLFSSISNLYQFSKFFVSGGLNFSVDFGVLNILILLTGFTSGIYYTLFKTISFIIANTNSYFWNKHWTFEDRQTHAGVGGYFKFLLVSVIGLVINVGVASLLVNVIHAQFGLSASIWANVGAAFGAIAGLFWNYIGYKFIVFKS